MTDDKNTALKVIEAILFANSDLVNEKDLLKNIPKSLNIKKLLGELKDIYKVAELIYIMLKINGVLELLQVWQIILKLKKI